LGTIRGTTKEATKEIITLRVQLGMLRLAEAVPRILGVLHCDFHLFFHFLISDVVWYLFGFDAAFVHEMPCAKRRIQFRDWPPFSSFEAKFQKAKQKRLI